MEIRRIKLFIKQSPYWQLSVFSILLPIAAAIFFALSIAETDKLLILHYSIPYGIDLVGEWREAFIVPMVGLGIAIINILFSFAIYVKFRFAAITTLVFTCICELVVATSVILIVFQNT